MAAGNRTRKTRPSSANTAEAEFTEDELRAALKSAGEDAVKSAHQKGLPVAFLRRVGGRLSLVHKYPDGREVFVRVYPTTNE